MTGFNKMNPGSPAEIEKFLKEREWGNDPHHPKCPLCHEIPTCGHNPNCAFARFLWHLNPMQESYDSGDDPLSSESVAEWMQENQALTDKWIDAIPECGSVDEPSADAQVFRDKRQMGIDGLWGLGLNEPDNAEASIRDATEKLKQDVRCHFRVMLAMAIVFGAKSSFTDGTSTWNYVSGFFEQKNRLPTKDDMIRVVGKIMKKPESSLHAGTIHIKQEGWIERVEIL